MKQENLPIKIWDAPGGLGPIIAPARPGTFQMTKLKKLKKFDEIC